MFIRNQFLRLFTVILIACPSLTNALEPFAELEGATAAVPWPVLQLVFKHLDPLGRNDVRLTCKRHHEIVDHMRLPVSAGGMGLSDVLPVIATVDLRAYLKSGMAVLFQSIVTHNHWLYVPVSIEGRAATVAIDSRVQRVRAVKGHRVPATLGEKFYSLADFYEKAVGVCSSETGEVLRLIPVKSRSKHALLSRKHLYVTHHLGNSLSIIDLASHRLIGEIGVGEQCLQPAEAGNFVFVVCSAPKPSLAVIKTEDFTRIARIHLESPNPQIALIVGSTLFIVTQEGVITAIDIGGYV